MLIIVALQHQIEKCRAGDGIGFLVVFPHVEGEFIAHGREARGI
nr:MAG TPA: hypothetical protein [Caudoviricetes sp.]